MLIDTHAHLTDERLAGQSAGVLARAKTAGVEKIIVPTTGILDGKRGIALAEKHEEVWAVVGIHPEILEDANRPENRDEWLAAGGEWLNRLEILTRTSKKIVGIGEIGLDFHYDKDKISLEIQREIFKGQLELGVKLNLPVVIHMRDAEEEMREILSEAEKLPRGQFHCFAGSDEFLDFVLDRGFYVSFCGNITFKSAGMLREQIKRVPLDRLLLETDSPYLTPEGKRGTTNEPANVKIIAEYIVDLLGVSLETLINQTTANARCLFFGG